MQTPTYTVNGAKEWAAEHSADLDRDRKACSDADVQMFNRLLPEKSKELWNTGIWLGERLAEHGANKDQIQSIQMAAGQRAFGGDAWKAAVDYANEFAATGDMEEKGGEELAVKVNDEIFGKEPTAPEVPPSGQCRGCPSPADESGLCESCRSAAPEFIDTEEPN